ncbi:MAG: hypothetical protein V4525_08260 [Pseudomonadota bacterium]
MISNYEKMIAELQTEVFSMTGLKIGKNDPLIASALLQSKLIKNAAESLYSKLSIKLEKDTTAQIDKLNTKINEHTYHLDERVEELQSISKKLLQSKEKILSEVTHKSQQEAMSAVKSEMIPLLNQYSAYKIYAIAALIGLLSGCIPIVLMLYLKK